MQSKAMKKSRLSEESSAIDGSAEKLSGNFPPEVRITYPAIWMDLNETEIQILNEIIGGFSL